VLHAATANAAATARNRGRSIILFSSIAFLMVMSMPDSTAKYCALVKFFRNEIVRARKNS
jgi:hypothetical protein